MEQTVDISNGQLPLKGVVLCCTSLSQDVRNKIAEAAAQMGAVHKLDLTADVTHLLVGSITTPKYRYVAKDRPDIKVLLPDWVDAVRESWIEGGDVDVQLLEKEYHLRPFTGLDICVTGFDDLDQRNFISETAVKEGATYHGDLTRQVTHLIAASPMGAKYDCAKNWDTKIVSLRWFTESLQRGMALDESLYDPLVPYDQQGKGAFRYQVKPRTSLGKRPRDDESQSVGDGQLSRKQLRRSVSTRLESQSQEMWQGISKPNVHAEPSDADQWKDDGDDTTPRRLEEPTEQRANKKKNTDERGSEAAAEAGQPSKHLLSGICAFVHGFSKEKEAKLSQVLDQLGAYVVKSLSALEDVSTHERYLIVPHDSSDAFTRGSSVPPNTTVATEWWVERCIHTKQRITPGEDVLSRPLGNITILEHSISTTGFSGTDLRQVAIALKLLGASYEEVISPSTTVLISGSATIKKEKAYYAKKHRIPIVSAEWLWALLETRLEPAFEKYEIDLPAFDGLVGEPTTSSPAAGGVLQKSANDSFKSKGDMPSKRLSSTRRSHAMPSLSLQTAKPSPSTKSSKPQPIVHEDDDDDTGVPDNASAPDNALAAPTTIGSQPLQELSPNLSPRKASLPPKADDTDALKDRSTKPASRPRTASPAKPGFPPNSPQSLPKVTTNPETHAPPPPPSNNQQLTASLAEIVDRSRPSSATSQQPPKRKKRPLGRAASGISNRSTSFSENASLGLHSDDMGKTAADGFTVSSEMPLPPSTQLGYETPEAEAHRLQMSKKMGTKIHDDDAARRVPSVGTVKDSSLSSDSRTGSRARGKGRSK